MRGHSHRKGNRECSLVWCDGVLQWKMEESSGIGEGKEGECVWDLEVLGRGSCNQEEWGYGGSEVHG